jgi:hypothetical protein
MNPKVTLYDETENGQLVPFTPTPTASQTYLWKLYTGGIKAALRFANGDDVIVLHDGDLTQGDKHPEQMVSTRKADHIEIAVANLEPWFEYPNVKHMKLAAGTSAHNFGEATAEILASKLLASKHLDRQVTVCYHGLMDYNGVTVDYAHHGPHPGSRIHLTGNTARFYLRDLMLLEICAGRIPPALVLRAHYHQHIDETVTVGKYKSRIICLPSYCMLGDYAIQRTQSASQITNGMIVFAITDGQVIAVREFVNTIDVRTREVVT